MIDETMKMPEPIIEPATSIVESSNPSPLTSFWSATGAPVSAIALHRRDYFRLKPTTAESKLPARVQINGAFNNVAIARELRIGGLRLIDEPVVTVDLANSSRAARLVHEQEIDGIIGADILFPTQAVLDCERQLLILKMDPDVAGNVPTSNWRALRAVPIQVSDS